MSQILQKVQEVTDMIIIDSPPALAVTDAMVMMPYVDGVLLVVKPGFTKAAGARQVVEQLKRSNANILGVVINELDLGRSRYSYKYYNYKGYTYYGKYYSHENPNA
jgi:Mrp family chromosome partitioning ATPase